MLFYLQLALQVKICTLYLLIPSAQTLYLNLCLKTIRARYYLAYSTSNTIAKNKHNKHLVE